VVDLLYFGFGVCGNFVTFRFVAVWWLLDFVGFECVCVCGVKLFRFGIWFGFWFGIVCLGLILWFGVDVCCCFCVWMKAGVEHFVNLVCFCDFRVFQRFVILGFVLFVVLFFRVWCLL